MVATQLPSRVAAVLFDMDNTLVASEDAWFAATRQLWDEVGADPSGRGILGGTVQDIVDEFVAEYPETDDAALSLKVLDLLKQHLAAGVKPTPGAAALVARLSTYLPVTIASNSPSVIVNQVVSTLGWQSVFTAALGTEDVENPKPAPDLYVTAAKRCGVNIADCVVFEDSPMGAAAARASGAFVVTVGPDAVGLGDLTVPSLIDPLVANWNPEAIA